MRFFHIQILLFKFILFYFASFAATAINADQFLQEGFDDWVVIPECYKKNNNCDKLCKGYYVEPEYKFQDSSIGFEQLPIKVLSNEGSFITKGKSEFKGNVIVTQGDRTISSKTAIIAHDENTGKLKYIHILGGVKITEPGVRIDGTEAYYFQEDDIKLVKNAKFRIYPSHLRGTSSELKSEGESLIYLPNSSYTTCAPLNNTWELKARKIKLNRETGWGQAWGSKLYVKDVPVFYWPYVNFPIDKRRKTGFLQPMLKKSNNFGALVNLPFYWNIAPNHDATISPYLTEKRGLRFLNEFRYLTNNSEGIFVYDFLPNDREYLKFRNQSLNDSGLSSNSAKRLALKDTSYRYAISLKHQTNFTDNFKLKIDYNEVGDDNYLQQVGPEAIQAYNNITVNSMTGLASNVNASTTADTTTALLQQFDLKYQNLLGQSYYLLQKYQILHPLKGQDTVEQYRKLPELGFTSNYFELPYNFNFKIDGIYTYFKIKENIGVTPTQKTFGKRLFIKPSMFLNLTEPGWYFQPGIKIHNINYNLNLNSVDLADNKPSHPDLTVPIYDLNTGLNFERYTKISGLDFIQTLEPRLYFLYVPNKPQDNLPLFDSGVLGFSYEQIFRDNRYSGFDRVSEAKQISYGLQSRFIAEDNYSEKARFGIAQILYFQDREVRANLPENLNNSSRFSPIAAIARYNFDPAWNIESNLVWDTPLDKFRTFTANLQYKPTKYNVLNAAYRFDGDPIKQLSISGAWHLNDRLRAIGKLDYDLIQKNFINALAGFEHYSCCVNLRFLVMRNRVALRTEQFDTQYDTSFALQIVLKGFGGTGSANPGMIATHIPGYEAPPDDLF